MLPSNDIQIVQPFYYHCQIKNKNVNFLYSYIAMLLSINNIANSGFNFMGQPLLIGMILINDHICRTRKFPS